MLLIACLSSLLSSDRCSGKTISNAPALDLMFRKWSIVKSCNLATTQCLDVDQPNKDLASRLIEALRHPKLT